MKHFWILALTLVLTAALFTGCGCTNTEMDDASTPTGMTGPMPTILPTEATTIPTTYPTRPTTEATIPDNNSTVESPSESITDNTDTTENTLESRSRNKFPETGSSNSKTSGR